MTASESLLSQGSDSAASSKEAKPDGQGEAVVHTEFLIVGTGPAGASLASFLGSHGLKGIMISSASGTADTPRAHITNMAARECLRDIGLDDELEAVASSNEDFMNHTRWCYSMAGEEFARIYSWGNDPRRKGDYELASPCKHVDLPQTLLEPLLVRYATHHGFITRFNTAFVKFTRSNDRPETPDNTNSIVVTVRDTLTNQIYSIHTKYLFGADGGRSPIAKQLNLPLTRGPGGGLAINVLVKADLSHLVQHRRGNLHWIMQPDRDHPAWGWMTLVRMVKPWDEWMFIVFPDPKYDSTVHTPSKEEYIARIREWIGDDSIPLDILSVAKWFINETVADTYSDSEGRIFCLGDAVHRHPPFNGLGSNTCIQDAYNLAWKIAYVHRGLAHPSLLDTYSTERQPVGKAVITRANDGFREHYRVWQALGTVPVDDLAERRKVFARLTDGSTPEGKNQRKVFSQAVAHTCHEFHGLGIEMGQNYSGASTAIYDADEPERPYKLTGRAAEDPILYYEPNTYPGSRLPHVWLNKAVPTKAVSTLDLAGHGAFALFTGIGGEAWKEAGTRVSQKLKLPIKSYSIGFRQEWEDFYFEWERLRGVEEAGIVLVRPDRFVAWRYPHVLDGGVDACEEKLMVVMRSILGLHR